MLLIKGNATITYYQYRGADGYKRIILRDVFYYSSKIANVNKNGSTDADSVYVFIPYSVIPNLTVNIRKDLIVPGNCLVEVSKSSEQTQSESLKALKNAGCITVMEYDPKTYGSKELWHYQLLCK